MLIREYQERELLKARVKPGAPRRNRLKFMVLKMLDVLGL